MDSGTALGPKEDVEGGPVFPNTELWTFANTSISLNMENFPILILGRLAAGEGDPSKLSQGLAN